MAIIILARSHYKSIASLLQPAHCHTLAFVIIEQAISRLLFSKALGFHHIFKPLFITTCAVLHYICLRAGDIFEPVEDVSNMGFHHIL